MTPLPKLNVMTLPWPADWAALFGQARPLILEIGFGRGQFLLHLARSFPDHNVIGIEISNRCLTHVEGMIARQRIANVRVIHAMAETALHHLLTPASLAQVHINFPDPWFRTRQSHRRLMQRDTLDAIVSRMQLDAPLYLATDIIAYAEMSHELLAATPHLENQLSMPWSDAMPGRIVTKYEAKARHEGRDCYYFHYRRNHQPAPGVPVIQESPMPHLVFHSPVSLDEVATKFDVAQHQPAPDTYVHFMRVWRSDDHLMFETHIKEPTIEQRLALTLSTRAGGRYTLQLSTLGHPRPTEGVHQAVTLLGDWLLGLHPESRVITRKLQDEQE